MCTTRTDTTNRAGRLRSGRVHHPPCPIAEATCHEWSCAPAEENGFGGLAGPPASALVAEPVNVRIYPLSDG